jgi:hypothetical protein
MSDSVSPQNEPTHPGSTENQAQAALFMQLVLQQSNMALMLLGQVPHPETGKTMKDLDAARLFIDLLEMLETKTKGNLTRQEEALLKQSLMTLRLTYVDAVKSPAPPPGSGAAASSGPAEPPRQSETLQGTTPAAEEEHRKKFTKKY